jgi:hypothetical protein
MKHIHFFGCSFTVGDELNDDAYFPWKKECKTLEEYYAKRHECNFDYIKYEQDNKDQAYPALLGGINHASNGAGLKENILKIIQLINSDTPIDAIYLQIPPPLRELYITDDMTIESIRLLSKDYQHEKYITTKIATHSNLNFAVNDAIDLITIDSFVRSKNINFGIISFGLELKYRRNELENSPFDFLNNELNKLDMVDFKNYAFENKHKIRLLGFHFTPEAHEYFAQQIKKHLADKFSILID